jgi:hypothetical protein
MLTFGAGGQFQDGVAAGIVGQHDRHAAGTEVQHDEEPLVELAFEAEDVWRRADQALRPGLQRGFARAQVDQPADERERRPGIALLRSTQRNPASATTGSQGSAVVKPAPGPA